MLFRSIKASLISNMLKILFLYFSDNIYLLVITHVSFTLLISYIGIIEFKKYKNYSFFDINLGTTDLAKSLFKKSSPLIFTNFAVILYLKVDQIMLEELSGEVEVALYSAALKFVEIFYVIPMALYTSFYPMFVKTHENNKDLFFEIVNKKVTIMINIFIVIGTGLMIFSPFIGELVYGSKYKDIGKLIFGLSFTIFFVNLGYIKTAFLIVTGRIRINLIINVIASVFNILANYFLLPLYGAKGAVIVSIVTYAYANFISCAFFKETKPLYKIFIARMRSNFLSNKLKKIRFS